MKNSVLMKEFVTVKDVGSDKACNFDECLVYLRNKPGRRVRITPVEIRKAERLGLLNPQWFANQFLTWKGYERYRALVDEMVDRETCRGWFAEMDFEEKVELSRRQVVLNLKEGVGQTWDELVYILKRTFREIKTRALMQVIREGEEVEDESIGWAIGRWLADLMEEWEEGE